MPMPVEGSFERVKRSKARNAQRVLYNRVFFYFTCKINCFQESSYDVLFIYSHDLYYVIYALLDAYLVITSTVAIICAFYLYACKHAL